MDKLSEALDELARQRASYQKDIDSYGEIIEELYEDRDRLIDFLDDIRKWPDAYPESVFPPLSGEEVKVMCESIGVPLDRISAHVLRVAVKGWAESADRLIESTKKRPC